MIRVLFLLMAAPLLWCQAEGRYYYGSMSVRTGVAFSAAVRSGTVDVAKQGTQRFSLDDPGTPGRSLTMVASQNGNVLAGGPTAGVPQLFVAVRAAAQPVLIGAGEWSAVLISLEGGKPRGLRTAFVDFTVAFNGVLSKAAVVSHESAVDDLCRADSADLKLTPPGTLEFQGVKYTMATGSAGDMFLATSAAPANPSLLIAARRDRDATTMAIRGAYAMAEIGARNSFAFAPDQARFFSTLGTVDANGGQARVSQRVALSDSALEFRGLAAYMVSFGGGGTFSPRLEQRRRNLALSGDGSLFLTAQVAEAGQLSLLHGIGIGIRVMEMTPPALAPRATAQGDLVSLYGRDLDRVQVLIGGQPAAIAHAWPNQINVKLAAPPASPLQVELDWQGGRTAPVSVAIASGPPEFASAPPAPGGFIAPAQPGAPGDTIELGLTGAPLPAGFAMLFDGVPGHVVSSAHAAGITQVKVTLPKDIAPSAQVNVALATPGHYVDLGDIAVTRPRTAAASR
jgi:uncharacterized protein (TIGR03437 family)